MNHQNILNLLYEAIDSKLVAGNWNFVNDQLTANYSVRNKTIYSIELLKSYLCDYNDAYILVRGAYNLVYRCHRT